MIEVREMVFCVQQLNKVRRNRLRFALGNRNSVTPRKLPQDILPNHRKEAESKRYTSSPQIFQEVQS